jgi:flagellar hook protein FlgE
MLGSVLHTALSGISAAEMAIDVSANNLANGMTVGFKASRVVFEDQSPRTLSNGVAVSAASGGKNPAQVGRGVLASAVDGDFSQGPILRSGNPLDLALEGNGFFVLEGGDGDRLYTRNGDFSFNGDGELVTGSGLRVLGHNVDANFQLASGDLEVVKVPSGSAASAQLTGFAVGVDGNIQGHFSDGIVRDLGQVQLAHFANPNGLVRRGQNTFSTGSNSGLPNTSNSGATRVVSGAREYSNTDVALEIVNLSLASTMFRGSIRVLETGDELLEELLNLRRP